MAMTSPARSRTRSGRIVKVVKQVVPENDGGTFNLGINGQVFTNGGAGFGDNQGTDFVAGGAGSSDGLRERP